MTIKIIAGIGFFITSFTCAMEQRSEADIDRENRSVNNEREAHHYCKSHPTQYPLVLAILKGDFAFHGSPSLYFDAQEKRRDPFSLKNMCLYKLLNKHIYDKRSIIGIIPRIIDLGVVDWNRYVKIKFYKYIALKTARNKAERNKIREQISEYCAQYLEHLKKQITPEINYIRGLSAISIIKLIINPQTLYLFNKIDEAQYFKELPEELKEIIYDPTIMTPKA